MPYSMQRSSRFVTIANIELPAVVLTTLAERRLNDVTLASI